ncbi:TPA: morphogenetic protein [Citrobacter freundii]
MKERGMIFNAEMVNAILSGRKTQTRRIMKNQPAGDCAETPALVRSVGDGFQWHGHYGESSIFNCPFGTVGDRIWVRETYGDCGIRLVYRADTDDGAKCKVNRWTPSIHMPRWASRILLEITDVRVEKLASVSDEEAGKEGYPADPSPFGGRMDKWLWFRQLWDSIYPEQSFKHNPWVWVIEFKRIEGGTA